MHVRSLTKAAAAVAPAFDDKKRDRQKCIQTIMQEEFYRLILSTADLSHFFHNLELGHQSNGESIFNFIFIAFVSIFNRTGSHHTGNFAAVAARLPI